ncbi:hypothetical protein ACC754_39690, partial [Rhizobium johnstonii]
NARSTALRRQQAAFVHVENVGIEYYIGITRGDFGSEAANSVARRLVVPPQREGGQAQFIHAPVTEEREGISLGPLIEWMRESLYEDQP